LVNRTADVDENGAGQEVEVGVSLYVFERDRQCIYSIIVLLACWVAESNQEKLQVLMEKRQHILHCQLIGSTRYLMMDHAERVKCVAVYYFKFYWITADQNGFMVLLSSSSIMYVNKRLKMVVSYRVYEITKIEGCRGKICYRNGAQKRRILWAWDWFVCW